MTMYVQWSCLLLAGCILSGCGSAEERKASYVAKAREFIQEENFPKARVALRNALKIDPKDPHVFFLAGQVSEKEANWQKAYGQYARVVELDSSHREAVGRLARFHLASQNAKELQSLADTVLARDPQDLLGQTLQACVWFLGGEQSQALAKAGWLFKQSPSDPDVLLMLAAIFSSNRELIKAQSVLQLGLTAHPDHVDLLNYLATISIGMKAYDQAEAIYLQLLAKEPRVYKHRDMLAGLYRHLGDSDRVLALLRKGVELDPDNEQRWKSLVMFADSSQREALLQESLEALPHSFMLRFLLGAHYEQTQEFQKAREVYEAIVREEETSGQGLKAEVELAQLDVAEENTNSAHIRLASVLKKNPRQFDALLLQGKMALAQNEGRQAVEAFRIVLKDEPNNSDIQSLLGQAHVLAGEFELAQESFKEAVSLNSRQFDAYSALARLSARQGQLEKAEGYLVSILQSLPTHMETLWSLFQLQLAQRQWAEGTGTITRLEKAGGSSYQVDLAKGLLAAGRQQWDQALQALSRAQKANPESMPPLAALMNVYLEQKRPEQGRAYLQLLVENQPDHPYAWGLLGRMYVELNDKPSALSSYRRQTEVNPAWVEPWKDLAMVRWLEGEKEEAIGVLNVALTTHPEAPVLLQALASFYQAEGQIDLAIQQYELVLSHSPDDVMAANNLAFLLADKKGDVESLEHALALTRNFEANTQNPFLLDTLAWVYYKLGLNEEATSVLKKALSKAPDHGLLNYHLGMVTLKAGDRVKAQQYLEKAMKRPSELEHVGTVRQLLADIKS
ncbi:tetratricopeptide repeat protein [uncultured Nitrospira sp.]|uniref:tetratricopeptide repeat protein n=1 Tax=uncultured Nitrospira sp. TaxID=157176 RepID=UPI003140ADAD